MLNKYYTFDDLNNFPEIVHLYTTKPFDFSLERVGTKGIEKGFKEIEKDLHYKFNKIVMPIQTHTDVVKIVDSTNINDEFNDVDGLITNMKNVALVTKTADCQSILLYDPLKKVIGNIHSGWRGTLNKIIKNAIDLMVNEFGCEPQNIRACICPSIMKCCFEVSEDVEEMFRINFKEINDFITLGEIKDKKQKYYIDTIKVNKNVLIDLGLKEENISVSNLCTKCNSNVFHSYRAALKESGRNIALICIKE